MLEDYVADFNEIWGQSGIDEVLGEAPASAYDYAHRLLKGALQQSDSRCQHLLRLLGDACGLHLDPKSAWVPFTPSVRFQGSRSSDVGDFSGNDLVYFSLALQKCRAPEVVARLGDILWVRSRDHSAALKAIDAYINSVARCEGKLRTIEKLNMIERASVISLQLGRNHEARGRVREFVEEHILDQRAGPEAAYFYGLLEIRLRFPDSIPEPIVARAQDVITWIKSNGAEILLRNSLETLTSVYRQNRDEAGVRSVLRDIADSFLRESNQRASAQPPDFLVASTLLDSAIHTLRRLPDTRDEIEMLKKRLMGFQHESLYQMAATTTPYDVSAIISETEKMISGLTIVDALLRMALIAELPAKQKLEERLKESIKNFPLSSIMPRTRMNGRGRVIAKSGPLLSNDSNECKQAFHQRLVEETAFYRQIAVSSRILPALRRFQVEHEVERQHLLSLLGLSPFVPPGREGLFARALLHGFRFDFVEAIHLLFPQVEMSIRYILESRGHSVTKIGDDGLQEEYDLSSLLYRPELLECLGEDLVFHLQALLVEKSGANLRNCAAHGLLEEYEFYSADSVFFWWLCLFLCFAPLANRAT